MSNTDEAEKRCHSLLEVRVLLTTLGQTCNLLLDAQYLVVTDSFNKIDGELQNFKGH